MIEWTEQATRQLDHVYEHIRGSNSEQVARRVITHVLNSVERLDTFPLSGRRGRVASTRELIVSDTPFIVAYSVQRARIRILAIYHGAQRWPEAFQDDLP
jgi:addiction module RelE/StbE family toxin